MKKNKIIYRLIVLLIIPLLFCINTSSIELDPDETVTHIGTYYYQLDKGREYAFFVVRSEAEDLTNTDDLLYIDQQKSDASGTVSFVYLPKELVPMQTVLRGENYENAKEVTWYFSNEGTLTVLGTGEIPSFETALWAAVEESVTKLVVTGSVTEIGANAFGSCSNLTTIVFEGDAPALDANAFAGITATAHYPADNATWTEEVLQNYGGTITWNSGHQHVYGEWQQVTAPGCETEGVEECVCSCGETMTRTIDALGHADGDFDHLCDTCKETISECIDENGDERCDICGKVPGLLGDVNDDGEVDVFDANLVVSYFYGSVDLTDAQITCADVNGDGEVDVFDANLIVSYFYGSIDVFPVEEKGNT